MAVLGSAVDTIVDVVSGMAPDGSQLKIAEILAKKKPILEDIPWYEGNLPTGHRLAAQTSLPVPSWRGFNEGVPLTKGAVGTFDESTASLEDFSQCDRDLAMMSGDVGSYRVKRGKPHIEGMGQKMAQTLFFGNEKTTPASFTGFGPRFNSLTTGNQKTQVIDAGGTGTNLRSIYLINWREDAVYGIYPKNTIAGLQHEDATSGVGEGINGAPPAMSLQDPNGNLYMGYRDHWMWKCGLAVEDWRYVIRIANINPATLTLNHATGAWLADLMTQALERIQDLDGNPRFYMGRELSEWMRRQALNDKNAFTSWDEMGGKKVMTFGEVMIRREDTLAVAEAQVS
jgi:hypothetical protein